MPVWYRNAYLGQGTDKCITNELVTEIEDRLSDRLFFTQKEEELKQNQILHNQSAIQIKKKQKQKFEKQTKFEKNKKITEHLNVTE